MQEQVINQESQCNATKGQKQAIGLLSVGTFLEYFDRDDICSHGNATK